MTTLLNEYRASATDTRNLGDKFERLIANYLVTDPLYAEKYSDVWLWGEWHDRSGADVGIDLIAKEERYAVTVDKDSGIKNNPNDWSENPRYILDLVKRIVRVSVESVKIVKGLPALEEKK